MNDCIIAMRSNTAAQKAARILTAQKIPCSTVNIDPSITRRGCGYGIELSCRHLADARRMLERKHVEYGDIIGGSGREQL